MFGAARLEKIKNIITEKKHVDVSTLSSLLAVTEVTVRKDLEKLEKQGFITKTHGGAMLNEKTPDDSRLIPDASNEDASLSKEKQMIGQIVAHMVKEHDSIFLGSGSTCCYIAKALVNKKNINIVTNNLNVANVLAAASSINVVLTGGNLIGHTMTLVGDIVQRTLEGIFIDKAFISVAGVHINNGFTVSNLDELNVYRSVLNIARELIVVADYSKFEKTSFVKFVPLVTANKVISNESIPIDYKAYFFEQGVQIFTSYEIDE